MKFRWSTVFNLFSLFICELLWQREPNASGRVGEWEKENGRRREEAGKETLKSRPEEAIALVGYLDDSFAAT